MFMGDRYTRQHRSLRVWILKMADVALNEPTVSDQYLDTYFMVREALSRVAKSERFLADRRGTSGRPVPVGEK